MARKSAAALAVLPRVDGRPSRLQPRPNMPSDIAVVFREIVGNMPPEHFKPTDAPLIEQYAQAIVWARRAHEKLDADGGVVDGKASPWLVVLEKSHRSSVALAGRLRLCPQSRIDPKTVGRQAHRPLSYYEMQDLQNADADDNAG